MGFNINSPAAFFDSFRIFSILLGLCIIGISLSKIKPVQTKQIQVLDICALSFISLVGGIITAWLSVGVGELVAIYLIIRRFPISFAVGIAVVVTAATVWSIAPLTFNLSQSAINLEIVLLAGPGAIIGGLLAKNIVKYLPENTFKQFFGLWLILVGIVG